MNHTTYCSTQLIGSIDLETVDVIIIIVINIIVIVIIIIIIIVIIIIIIIIIIVNTLQLSDNVYKCHISEP